LVLNNFHKNFRLNNNSFSSKEELQLYTKGFSKEIHLFLNNWFSKEAFIIVHTSGSTGTPKPISLKKEYVLNSAKATGHYFNLPENTSALLCLPIQYIAGKLMLIRALTLGWALDVVETNSNPIESIHKNYDFSAMVPLQLENSLSNIHLIKKLIVGGGVVSNSLQEKLQHISTEVFATYGMTETITHIAAKKLNGKSSLLRGKTKQSLNQNELKPLEKENNNAYLKESNTNSENNQQIASQKSAHKDDFYEILPNVTIYKDDRNCLVIKAPKVSDEIIFTNDVVDLVSDTQFEWLGRFDNVINSGGVKLHPEKIEEKLAKIISQRFFVIGVPNEKLGEKLVLIIEGNSEVIRLEKANLSKFENPKEIFFINNFIETATGKIQRKKTLAKINTK
jgi:O-succinylbenzoic acid--CoA ligase